MDIIVALRPKNMTVRETASSSTGQQITTYIFNAQEYSHIGTWPPIREPGGFHVPIASAEVVETSEDITQAVRRFAGPRHVVTDEIVRYAIGTWIYYPSIEWSYGRIRIVWKPHIEVPDKIPHIRVTNVLGHVSFFGTSGAK